MFGLLSQRMGDLNFRILEEDLDKEIILFSLRVCHFVAFDICGLQHAFL